jgi:hypothetical protein
MKEPVVGVPLRRDREACERVAKLFLPCVPKSQKVTALDPEQADLPLSVCRLESDADLAAAMKQREIAIREVVDLFEEFGDEQVLLIEKWVDHEAALLFPSDGGDILVTDRIDAAGDADIVMLQPAQPQRSQKPKKRGEHRSGFPEEADKGLVAHGKKRVMLIRTGGGNCFVQINHAGSCTPMKGVMVSGIRIGLHDQHNFVPAKLDREFFVRDAFRIVGQFVPVHRDHVRTGRRLADLAKINDPADRSTAYGIDRWERAIIMDDGMDRSFGASRALRGVSRFVDT